MGMLRYDFRFRFISLFSLLLSLNLAAQFPAAKFEYISTKDGLNQNSVLDVYQDNDGFLWIGTYAGLNRYDGNTIFGYKHNYLNEYQLSDMHIRSICKDTNEILLIATTSGINRFFPKTREFLNFSYDTSNLQSLSNNTVYKVIKDRDGDIWLATWGGGLNKMVRIPGDYADERMARYTFQHYLPSEEKGSISSAFLGDLDISPDGLLWIAANNGLNVFDKKTNTFRHYKHNPLDANSLSYNDISTVGSDRKGNIWIGTWGGGLNYLDRRTGKILRFKNSLSDNQSLSHNIIMNIYCDRRGDMWIATWGGGLNYIDIPDQYYTDSIFALTGKDIRFIRYQHEMTDPNSISGNSVYCIYEDSFNNIWVGTDWNGLNRLDISKERFKHFYAQKDSKNNLINNVVFSLLLNDNKLWIGTEEGVNILDRETNTFQLFQYSSTNANSISHNHIRSLLKDNEGNIWLGTENGLNKYQPESNSFKRYTELFEPDAKRIIISLLQTRDGNIWLGTYGDGLVRFNPKTLKFKKFRNLPDNPNSLSNDIVWKTLEDKNGNIWIATGHGGLCKYEPAIDKFTRYQHNPKDSTSISSDIVVSLYIDKNETLWLGTRTGLDKMEYTADNKVFFRHYNEKNGFSAPTIDAIIEDEFGNLWLTTSKGLTRFNPETLEIATFFIADGLQGDEFSINSIARDVNTHEIFIGGINGFNIFKPSEIEISSLPPETKIVNLKILHNSVEIREKINDRVILDQDIVYKDNIEFSYKDQIISFVYSAIQYNSQLNIEFAYMLEGYDKNWNYVKNERIATYRHLPPGKYTFKVKAANKDGIWHTTPASIRLFIKPPWWNTMLFKTLLSILIITTTFGTYFFRVRLLKKRQQMLENMVHKRTEELSEANVMLEEKQEEITIQNEELVRHRNDLEELIKERTAELYTAKLKAEESDKLKSAFLANMSHEIRTPLNAIVGFSGLLIAEEIEKDEKVYFGQMIQNNSDTLLTLINDIIDISLIEANQLVIYKDNFCIDDILKEIMSYYQLKNKKNIDIQIVVSSNTENTIIKNDSTRFRQIITNLVGNAIKFTDKGYVRFGYKTNKNDIEIFVEDTGIGIRYEDQAYIFDHFHKLDPNKEKFYEGTGIGLSISKKLANLMGGDLKFSSEPNKGSRFYLLLPREESDTTQKRISDTQPLNYNFKDLLFIIAEDEPNNYNLIHRILRKTDAQILWAKNGVEAVSHVSGLQENQNCIVLMDIKMPVMNGIEATKRIKKLNKNIPVIAITAFAQAGDKAWIMNSRFDDYISKPLNPQILLEKIAAFYKRRS